MQNDLKKANYSIEEKLFLALWAFYSIFYFLFNVSELAYDYNVYSLAKWGRDVTMVLQIALIFYINKNSLRNLIIYSITIILAFIIEISLASKSFQITILFILLASQIDFNKILRFDFKLKIILLAVIVGMCLFGITTNYTDVINGNYKQALGFTHPNTLTCYVLMILVEWLCIRYKRMKWFEWLLILAIWVVVMQIGGGRTTGYTFLGILVLYALATLLPKAFYSKFSKFCFAVITPLLAVFSFVTVWLYRSGNKITEWLNSVVTGRIDASSRFLENYGISIFGQQVEYISMRQHKLTGEPTQILDNAYIRCAINWGVVISIILLILFSWWFVRMLNNRRVEIALFGLFFVIIGFAETYMTDVMYNLSFLCLFYGLVEKGKSVKLSADKSEIEANNVRAGIACKENISCRNIILGVGVIFLAWSNAGGIWSKYINRMIYPFLFLAIGVFYSSEKSLKQYTAEVMKKIYIPFAFWNLLFNTIRSIYTGMDVQSILYMDLRIVLTLDKDGTYFGMTWILGGMVLIPLVYKIIDTIVHKFKYKEYLLLILFGLIAILGFQVTLPYKMSRILILGFFFAIGAFIGKNPEEVQKLFYPCNAVICTLLYVFIAYNHYANMGTNNYSNPTLFIFAAFFAAFALLYYCDGINGLKSKIGQSIKKGLSYLGTHWIDVMIWELVAFRIVIILQMAMNHEVITWANVLTYYPTYSTAYGWWIAYFIVGIAVPILFCNLLRSGPWGKFFRKVHIV